MKLTKWLEMRWETRHRTTEHLIIVKHSNNAGVRIFLHTKQWIISPEFTPSNERKREKICNNWVEHTPILSESVNQTTIEDYAICDKCAMNQAQPCRNNIDTDWNRWTARPQEIADHGYEAKLINDRPVW